MDELLQAARVGQDQEDDISKLVLKIGKILKKAHPAEASQLSWTLQLPGNEQQTLIMGYDQQVSPDRSLAAFLDELPCKLKVQQMTPPPPPPPPPPSPPVRAAWSPFSCYHMPGRVSHAYMICCLVLVSRNASAALMSTTCALEICVFRDLVCLHWHRFQLCSGCRVHGHSSPQKPLNCLDGMQQMVLPTAHQICLMWQSSCLPPVCMRRTIGGTSIRPNEACSSSSWPSILQRASWWRPSTGAWSMKTPGVFSHTS